MLPTLVNLPGARLRHAPGRDGRDGIFDEQPIIASDTFQPSNHRLDLEVRDEANDFTQGG